MSADETSEALRWLALAREDLVAAGAMLSRDDVAPRIACFLAQQAAEKAIKALLIRRRLAFPRIHDLVALRALLPVPAQARLDAERLVELSVWAIEARYPGDLPQATAAEARRMVQTAGEVVESAGLDLAPR